MPLFRSRRAAPPPPPDDPAAWRPQGFGKRRAASIDDPIVEPGWEGVHAIVHVAGGVATVRDEEAVDCTAEFQPLAGAIAAAALADELVLDGYLTVQPTQETAGAAPAELASTSQRELLTQFLVGGKMASKAPPTAGRRRLDPDRPIAFVAVDLLVLDGTRLLDLPLLERKRLLDGALREGELVRITPFVRPPIGTFMMSWRTLGFGALAFKASNSRYVPNEANDDWAASPIPQR